MHFVLLATHSPDTCPTSNSTTRDVMSKIAPEIPKIAERAGIKFVAGPLVNREHTIVVVVDADSAENVDRFLVESRLGHWNSVRILPSLTMEEGMKEIEGATPIF